MATDLEEFKKNELEKQKGSSYSAFLYRYLALKLMRFFIPTNITANQITVFGQALFLIGCVLFFYGYNVLGFVLVFLWHIADYLDGTLARYKKQTSKMGEWLDHVGNIILIIICILAITYKAHIVWQDYWIWLFGFLSITAIWINYHIFLSFNELNIKGQNIRQRYKKNKIIPLLTFNFQNMVPIMLLAAIFNRMDIFLVVMGSYGWFFAIVSFLKLTLDIKKS